MDSDVDNNERSHERSPSPSCGHGQGKHAQEQTWHESYKAHLNSPPDLIIVMSGGPVTPYGTAAEGSTKQALNQLFFVTGIFGVRVKIQYCYCFPGPRFLGLKLSPVSACISFLNLSEPKKPACVPLRMSCNN